MRTHYIVQQGPELWSSIVSIPGWELIMSAGTEAEAEKKARLRLRQAVHELAEMAPYDHLRTARIRAFYSLTFPKHTCLTGLDDIQTTEDELESLLSYWGAP